MISKSETARGWRSPWLVMGVFSLVGLATLSQHAMWRDEFNPWLIVRDSTSWLDWWQNIRYEGHPLLWYLCLSGLHGLTHSVVSMQIFHFVIGVASVGLLWRYSPFRPLEKLLFTFGYFPFFEYLIISRNYSLGLFFCFLFCSLFFTRKYSYLPLAVVLGLMANSHAYAFFIALALALMLGLEWLCDRTHRQQYLAQASPWDLMASIVIVGMLYGLAAYVISPPANSYLHGGREVLLKFDLRQSLIAIGRLSAAYFQITPNAERWLDLIVTDALILGIVALVLLKLSRKPWVLLFYSLATILIVVVFFYFKQEQLRGLRHFGSLYVVLITSLWLAGSYADSLWLTQRLRISPNLVATANQVFKRVFIALLACHCVIGLFMVGQEYFLPYSAGRATARYMRSAGLQNEFILASPDAKMAPIAGYLKRKLYYPEIQGWGSFTLFRAGRVSVAPQQVLDQAIALLRGEIPTAGTVPDRILLVLNEALDLAQTMPNALVITPIEKFERSYINTEQYYLYWLSL